MNGMEVGGLYRRRTGGGYISGARRTGVHFAPMKLHLDKPWLPLTEDRVAKLSGQMGVFQLADEGGRVTYIGFAGGKSLFGLRSELQKRIGAAAQFRFEVNNQYQTRWRELLMLHQAANGGLPELNRNEPAPKLGRLG